MSYARSHRSRSSRAISFLAAVIVAVGVFAAALRPQPVKEPQPLPSSVLEATGRGTGTARAPLVFGATAHGKQEILDHEKAAGRPMAGVRVYKSWDSKLFSASEIWARDTDHTLFLSIKAQRTTGEVLRWRDIADASPGSRLHNEMLAQARQLRDFGARVYVTFNHEPEAHTSAGMGSAADFVAAWRKLVNVYRNQGVENAQFVWTMTAWGFKRTDEDAAHYYYPGDAYVDHIGADGYNWYKCRTDDGRWTEMAEILSGHRQFGAAHPDKGLMLMEWSSVEDPAVPGRKAAWFRDVTELFKQPGWEQYRAVLHFSGRSLDSDRCEFDYRTSRSATKAWRDMGSDPAFQG